MGRFRGMGRWLPRPGALRGRGSGPEGRLVVFLTTKERGSDRSRTHAVHALRTADVLVLPAAVPGRPHLPGWYLDLQAEAQARIRMEGSEFPVVAETLSMDERDGVWPEMVAVYPECEGFQRATTWAIPLVRLRRANPAGGIIEPPRSV